MPAYIIVQVDVHDAATYETHKAAAPPSIAMYGGRYLVRGGPVEQLEGDWRPSRLVILEFPTADQARAWWSSSEYVAAKGIRQACAGTEMILMEGFVPTADPGDTRR